VNRVTNFEKISDIWDAASFIGKALHGIATNRPFTEKDAKDAIDAMSAVAKLGSDYLAVNEDESKEIKDFFNAISDAGKGTIDYIGNGDSNG
jgi:type IV secretory pathway ATPase VirB11/archaellum biosynthesis ATPase